MTFDRKETHVECDGCAALRQKVAELEERNRSLWIQLESALRRNKEWVG